MEWSRFGAYFRGIEQKYKYDQKTIESVIKYRKENGGLLFIDRILGSIGLKQASKLYPPKSAQQLQNLWDGVLDADADGDQRKHAVLLYMIRDLHVTGDAIQAFAKKAYLSPRYEHLITGLWELDHCQFSRALEVLTNPSLTPEFSDDILYTLLKHPKSKPSQAIAYYVAVQPPLNNELVLEAYFELLCQNNILGGYEFTRTCEDGRRKVLFGKLIEEGMAEGEQAQILISLPFSPLEETWFEQYLLHGPGSRLLDARDSVLMRKLAKGHLLGRPGDLNMYRGEKINGISWDDIRMNIEKASS